MERIASRVAATVVAISQRAQGCIARIYTSRLSTSGDIALWVAETCSVVHVAGTVAAHVTIWVTAFGEICDGARQRGGRQKASEEQIMSTEKLDGWAQHLQQ